MRVAGVEGAEASVAAGVADSAASTIPRISPTSWPNA
jgi:hypothetical protein